MFRRSIITLLGAAFASWSLATLTTGTDMAHGTRERAAAHDDGASETVRASHPGWPAEGDRLISDEPSTARAPRVRLQRYDGPERVRASSAAQTFQVEQAPSGARAGSSPTRTDPPPPGASAEPDVELTEDLASAEVPPAETAVTGQSGRLSALASVWSREPRDPARSREMDAYMRETAQAARLDPNLVKDTDCGASVCRVTLSFARVEDALAFQEVQGSDFDYAVVIPAQPSPAEPGSGSAPAQDGLAPEPGTDATPRVPIWSPALEAQASSEDPLGTPGEAAEPGAGPLELEIMLAHKDAPADRDPAP